MTVTDTGKPLMLAPAADPAPLGLAAFALTTFLLSAANANWMTRATGSAWLGFAFSYGGLCQLLAGLVYLGRGRDQRHARYPRAARGQAVRRGPRLNHLTAARGRSPGAAGSRDRLCPPWVA